MFQSFESKADPMAAPPRVARVRALMEKRGWDAFLVPRADEHQGEYVPPSAGRLRWLTGFSGSSGLAVIGKTWAMLLVDGRYTLQARMEVDPDIFELQDLKGTKLSDRLGEKLPKDGVVAFDPWLHTAGYIEQLGTALEKHGLVLKPAARNPVDIAWGRERPPPPSNPVMVHPLEFAGRSAEEKIADVREKLVADKQDAVVLTLPDSIAWLFNIRGSDMPHNPVALAFAIVPVEGKPEMFIAPAKLTPESRIHLERVAALSPPADLPERVRALRQAGNTVRLDCGTAAHWFARALGPKALSRGADPCLALKARKNTVEIEGARAAHVRDGAAVTRFLAWLDREAAEGGLDEIAAVRQLESFRRATNKLREISFGTIAGSGPNGAIVHYRVTGATNRELRAGDLFVIDSGGQYQDGTTDITRTVAIGVPSDEMRERFSLVLKGHIAIATARFPEGTRGIDLDPFARRALWEKGLDYGHGTGHGVGSFLSVHEGPQSISKSGMAALEPGMICSNEPGYYKEGHYGIRIENLVLVTPPETIEGGEQGVLGFETLTLAPIDRRLVVRDLLTEAEIGWLDAYHARVAEVLAHEVDPETRSWLAAATAPLG